jgi:hypothetical chaperone protein
MDGMPTTPALPAASCGLDFGTSNSTLAIAIGEQPALVPLEGSRTTIPSAIFFSHAHREVAFGREARRRYIDGESGRLMRALKSVIGTTLFREETRIQGRRIALSDVLVTFLKHLKSTAEALHGRELTKVVLGRPVHFIDGDDPADRRAEGDLETAARAAGFTDILFQYEPVAAALHFEQTISGEKLALVADIGGGTADFSLVRTSPERARAAQRSGDILANRGIRVGGTDFDRMLSLAHVMPLLGYGSASKDGRREQPRWIYHDLSTWSQIHFLYVQKTMSVLRALRQDAARPDLVRRLAHAIERQEGHRILEVVEQAKIALTDQVDTTLALGMIEPDLAVALDRAAFEDAIRAGVARITAEIVRTIADAGIATTDVDVVFLTGGSAMVPCVRHAIAAVVADTDLVAGDMFGSVGKGLGLDALRKFCA